MRRDGSLSFELAVEGHGALDVVGFTGHEAISSLFEFRVEIACAEIDPAGLVGMAATLVILAIDFDRNSGPDDQRRVHGFVCQAEYVGASADQQLYELTLVPWIWRLQQRSACRIFQQLRTTEILEAVLVGSGLPKKHLRMDLTGTYAPRDYCTQYNETDLDFICRLMEADGIYYYFEHEEDRHVLVLSDSPKCEPPGPDDELGWAPDDARVRSLQSVTRLRLGALMRPTQVALRDINLHRPETKLEVSAGDGDARELYEYPGGYQATGQGGPHLGGQQARLRLQAQQATASRAFGTSTSPYLQVGRSFALEGHPFPGADGQYRALRLNHRGVQTRVLLRHDSPEFHYSNEFECMPIATPYRAPRVTPRPIVRGVQTATVVGPDSEEVHVDEHGRVKIKFHWDRSDAADETSSCWVRVSQMWAGNSFGAMFLPRIGHEVIVDFIEGDPDRPLITGRIYTGFNKPPYPLPDEKTKSTIKSESSPGGGGSNELRFEDMKGSEEVYLHAQRDLKIAVEHDAARTVGHDDALTVDHDRTKLIKHDETEEIQHDRTIKVGNNHTEKIGVDMQLEVGANLSATVGGGKSVSVRENSTESAGQNLVLTAGKHLTLDAAQNINVSSGASTRVVVGDKLTIACGAATITIQSSGAVTIQTGGAVTVKGSSIKLN